MESYYEFTRKVLLTLGIDMDRKSKFKIPLAIIRYSTPFLIFLCSIQMALFFITHDRAGFMSIGALCTAFFTTQSWVKSLAVISNQDGFTSIRNRLNAYYEKLDKDETTKTSNHLQRIQKVCKKLFMWAMAVIWIFNFLPLFIIITENMTAHKSDVELNFPTQMWYPFDALNYYIPVYAYNIYVTQMYMATQIITDHYFVLIVFDLAAHFDRLGEKFKLVINEAPKTNLIKSREKLKILIEYHSELMNILYELNEMYGFALLVEILASSIVVAVVGFIMQVRF